MTYMPYADGNVIYSSSFILHFLSFQPVVIGVEDHLQLGSVKFNNVVVFSLLHIADQTE